MFLKSEILLNNPKCDTVSDYVSNRLFGIDWNSILFIKSAITETKYTCTSKRNVERNSSALMDLNMEVYQYSVPVADSILQ